MSRGHGCVWVQRCNDVVVVVVVVVVVIVNDGDSVVVRDRSSVGRRLDECIVECIKIVNKFIVNREWQNDRGGSRRLVFMVLVDVAAVKRSRKICCYGNFYCRLSTVQRCYRNKGLGGPGWVRKPPTGVPLRMRGEYHGGAVGGGVSVGQKGRHGRLVSLCFCYVNSRRKQYQNNFFPEGYVRSELCLPHSRESSTCMKLTITNFPSCFITKTQGSDLHLFMSMLFIMWY